MNAGIARIRPTAQAPMGDAGRALEALGRGADPNTVDADGDTALDFATRNGCTGPASFDRR